MSDYLKNSLDDGPGSALTPNSTPDDVLGVVEILSLITDPAALKQRLDQLNNTTAEANRKIAEAKTVSEKRRTAENMFAEAAKKMDVYKAAGAKLDARDGDLTRREKDLIDREGKHNQRVKDHGAESERLRLSLVDRATALAGREKLCAQEERRLAEERVEIERQKAQVREFSAKFARRSP